MERKVEKVIKDIKALKIQGARNIAKAVVNAIILQIQKSKAKTLDELYSELLVVSEALASARPTEPMVRNAVGEIARFAFSQIKTGGVRNAKELREKVVTKEKEYLKKMDENAKALIEYGAKLIPEGAVVMTHCHSSTVTGILKRAAEMGNQIEVFACETRPRYQGRITAKELVDADIKVSLIVDSAMNSFMKKAEICLVGADAITSRGDLINKIGTSTLAHIAEMHDVSFYSAAELYKYSPISLFGNLEKIEERDSKEVWDKPPKGLVVRNPAFDVTAAQYINGYITEAGVVPPQSLFTIASKQLGIEIEKK
ncbi:TPA: S-methyl-5-thioribose-1-phosphate isomerase [Candidatus Micrarchaeota archaeon]|nr:S-methyl-5-thioribose-1-phosphate isomerase [Candidatus Micrarchaeota archaeon]